MTSLRSCSVPSVVAQGRAAVRGSSSDGPRLACVRCGVDIRTGSWCNECRETMSSGSVARRLSRHQVALRLSDSDDCDCGRPRPPSTPSCSRCAWLDRTSSVSRLASLVVAFLRTRRWATLAEITAGARTSRRNAVEALRRLVRVRRVARELEELDTGEITAFRGGGSRFLYRLDG